MKKLGTALCLSWALITSAPVQAGCWQGNWLVGASGGYYDRDGDLLITGVTSGPQTVVRRGAEDIGWLIGILGGYEIRCNRWLLGAELNVDWYDNHKSDHDLAYTDAFNLSASLLAWDANFKYRREWLVGLTARLGYEIAPCLLPYIRLGAEWSEDKLSYRAVAVPSGFSIGTIENREDSISPIIGIGLEVPMPRFNCFSVRAEYDFHFRVDRVNTQSAITAPIVGTVGYLNVSRKPYTQTGIVSIVWNI